MVTEIRSFVRSRYPENQHWQSLDKLFGSMMEPEEFVNYWHVTYSELGKIVGCSESTAAHWFCRTDKRPPTNRHKQRLALVHKVWSKI